MSFPSLICQQLAYSSPSQQIHKPWVYRSVEKKIGAYRLWALGAQVRPTFRFTGVLGVGHELIVGADVEDVDQHLRYWNKYKIHYSFIQQRQGFFQEEIDGMFHGGKGVSYCLKLRCFISALLKGQPDEKINFDGYIYTHNVFWNVTY